MLKMLFFYKRRADLTYEQFCDHWRNVHTEVIKKHPNLEGNLIRYVQHALTPDAQSGGAPGLQFDGCSEAWFAGREAMETIYSDPYFQSAVVDDEKEFIDMAATRWAIVDEPVVVFTGPEGS